MRRPDTAIARRDDLLARTRRLTLLVAGGASAATIALATVLGLSIPGKAATTGTRAPASPSSKAPATPGRPATGRPGTNHGHGTRHSTRHRHLARPTQAPSTPVPSKSKAPPTTSSGGS
jgi:hypothetical protein